MARGSPATESGPGSGADAGSGAVDLDGWAEPGDPSWFRQALAVPVETGRIDSGGAGVGFAAWGEPGRPGLVFVHGGGANLHWWRGSVPALADRYRVVALDLSGHGDSDRRAHYDPDVRATEIVDAAGAAGIRDPFVVVAHSMGGFVSIRCAARHRDRVRGVVLLDSPIEFTDEAGTAGVRARRGFAVRRAYPDRAAAAAAFRTLPEQPNYLPFVRRLVAWNSVMPTDGGWVFKTDLTGIVYPGPEHAELLADVDCDLAMIRAGDGLVGPEAEGWFADRLGRPIVLDCVPDAGHHMMLDKPLEMVTAIEGVLSAWVF